jgi:signal transduction histidine kinase
MPDDALRILLFEDNPGDARLIKEALSDASLARWHLSWRETLSEGVALLAQESFVAVLLDLTLPDCSGAETIARVHQAAPRIPVVVLTGIEDEAIARDAVKTGAQDYLVKGSFDGRLLSRSLLYAIDRARFREELEKARDVALQAVKLKSEFLAVISHEMRTPMNAILGPLELLVDTALDEEQTELASTALAGSRAMLTLIDDILDYSRLAAGEFRLRDVAFEIAEPLDAVMGEFSGKANEKGLGLKLKDETAHPLLLAGDPTRLGQVLVNLIGNAIKFTEQGEISIGVACEVETSLEAKLRFTIADTGIGIAEEFEEKLFAPFAQADGSSTRKYGGTGLGLAIAAQIVERMGGEIGVTSIPGAGSTFWFTARMRKAPSSMLKLTVPRRVTGANTFAARPGPRLPRPRA